MNPKWTPVKFPSQCVAIDAGGLAVWAIDGEGRVYVRKGISFENPLGTDWQKVDGRLSTISVSPTMSVVGLNKSGKIFFRSGIQKDNIAGDSWEKISGGASGIAFAECAMWAWNLRGDVFFREGLSRGHPSGKKWVKCDGSVSMISAGSGVAFAIGKNDGLMRRKGITDSDRKGICWEAIDTTELHFGAMTMGNLHRISFENSVATSIKAKSEEVQMALRAKTVGMDESWLQGSCGILNANGSFEGGRCLYTWQIARRTVKLRRVIPKLVSDDKAMSKQNDAIVRQKLSPKAARALSDISGDRSCFLRAVGLGPLLCDGDEEDEACHFYCDFANKAVDWRGYMDTSTVFLRSVKSGRYVHLDRHTMLPHVNGTKMADSCVLGVRSNFEAGDVAFFFQSSGKYLNFSSTGTPVKPDEEEEEKDDRTHSPQTAQTRFVLTVVDDGSGFRARYPDEYCGTTNAAALGFECAAGGCDRVNEPW
eukprot:g2638.t1